MFYFLLAVAGWGVATNVVLVKVPGPHAFGEVLLLVVSLVMVVLAVPFMPRRARR
jgi:hypothetical protein